MNDLINLLKNKIRDSLERLQKEQVGYINIEDSIGFQYCIDGKYFYIAVKEVGGKNE